MANPNEELLRRGYEAFAAGDIEGVLAVFADDIAWHVGGESLISGDYDGHQEVLGFLGRLVEITGGTFRLDVHDVLANDTHGVALATAYAQRGDRTLDMRQVQMWHLAGGKATEFWTFAEDSAELDQFFS
jgi:uncharacterized protein